MKSLLRRFEFSHGLSILPTLSDIAEPRNLNYQIEFKPYS